MGGGPIERLTEQSDVTRAALEPIADGAVAVAVNVLLIALWIPFTLKLIFSRHDDAVEALANQQRDSPTPDRIPTAPKPKESRR